MLELAVCLGEVRLEPLGQGLKMQPPFPHEVETKLVGMRTASAPRHYLCQASSAKGTPLVVQGIGGVD